MQIRVNETRNHRVENETVNGIQVMVYLQSSVANQDIPETSYMNGAGFDASQISVETKLMRNGKVINIHNNNLAVLAHFWTQTKGGTLWRKGVTLRDKAAGVYQVQTRSVFIPFGGHINVTGKDQLSITVTVGRSTFGAGVDAAVSSIQVEANQSIGVEHAVYKFNEYAIDSAQGQDVVNLGDNVVRVAMMSFETDPFKTIFKQASLSSDRLDWTDNQQQLILRHFDKFPYNAADNLLSALPTSQNALKYPASFLIFNGEGKDELDQAKLTFIMESANIAASQNFICWLSYETNADIVQKAIEMQQKHNKADADKIPVG